jgi:2-polyprenyl-3-methyl-5-hydroxy-6-metoxy-1,4-benzoquinol methylase
MALVVMENASQVNRRAGLRHMPDLERWEARLGAAGYLFDTEPDAFLRGQAGRLRRGQRALAVAGGEGRNGTWLAEQQLDVVSVDFSPTALAKARQLARSRGVELSTVELPKPAILVRTVSATGGCVPGPSL